MKKYFNRKHPYESKTVEEQQSGARANVELQAALIPEARLSGDVWQAGSEA